VLGHVEHAARLPVVGLVGHALLEGATACTARKRTIKTRTERETVIGTSRWRKNRRRKKEFFMFLNLLQ
jgi:hypothetical protein